MDKTPQVPIFACGHFWRHVHHSTYFTSSRYAELSRQTSSRDANFLLLWQLVDSLSSSALGEVSGFSHSHRLSPLTHAEQAKAQKISLTHRPTASYRNRVRQLLDTNTPRLKASAPSSFPESVVTLLSLHSTLMPAALRAESKKQKILDDLCPPDMLTSDTPNSPAVPTLRGRPRTRQPSHLYLHKHLRRDPTPPAPARRLTFAGSVTETPSNIPESSTTLPSDWRELLTLFANPNPRQPSGPLSPVCKLPKSKQARPSVPHTMLLLKHKWKDQDNTAPLKVREVITHGSHPFKKLCRHFGRCLTMLWKYAPSLPSSIERVSMRDLLGFVDSLKGSDCNESSVWGELDLVEMFPNIPRSKIIAAMCYFWKKLCKEKRWDWGVPQ